MLGSTRVVPLPVPTSPIPRVHPSPARHYRVRTLPLPHGHDGGVNMAVGLRSVGQLSLDAHISGLRGMTEVYNVINIGRINNHFTIPQKE